MKKILLTACAVVALALTSCSEDETLSQNTVNSDEIAYSVVGNNATRTTVYCNYNLPGSFKVYGALKDGSAYKKYFMGDEIVKDGTVYKDNTGIRYWVTDKTIDFYALADLPTSATVDYDTNKGGADDAVSVTNFVSAENVKDQKDVLYAAKLDQAKPETTPATKVALNFRHALAQIQFKVKNAGSTIAVDVKGVTIKNVVNKGSFTFGTSTDGNVVSHENSTTTTSGTYASSVTWTPGTDLGDSKLELEAVTDGFVGYVEAGTDAKLISSSQTANATTAGEADNGDVMMVIPQTTTVWVPATGDAAANLEGKVYLSVNCRIYNVADGATGVDRTNDIQLYGESGNFKEVLIPIQSVAYAAGKKYIYTLIFGKDNGDGNGGGGYDPDDPDNPILTPITYDLTNTTVDDFILGETNPADGKIEMKTN